MTVELNHTIVASKDPEASAQFLADILGLPAPKRFGHFWVVDMDNGVSLDFDEADEPIRGQHYAFLVSDDVFDEAFARITAHGLPYWADPGARRPQEINTRDSGRGFYFRDPNGHFLELLTRPYGSGTN